VIIVGYRPLYFADELALSIYRLTRAFPADERYGLSSQLRRSAVSVGANIVEGSARLTEAENIRFLSIAYGSACELEYELSLAHRHGYLTTEDAPTILALASESCRMLRGLFSLPLSFAADLFLEPRA
jgi:four helix bundle protein